MKIWKNTATLDGYDSGLDFTNIKDQADILLLGSKSIDLDSFKNLLGIFRVGIGNDNVPEKEAESRGILVRYPSKNTIDNIYEETSIFTCSLIFRMLYDYVGSLDPWIKHDRQMFSDKLLLIIGTGNIGKRVVNYMQPFMKVITFDIMDNGKADLDNLIKKADCISLHIPKSNDNTRLFDKKRLSLMKDGSVIINTARGAIIDEDALYLEIKSQRLRAAFDVFWEEPYRGKLMEYFPDKFYMTPHIAGYTDKFLLGCRNGLDCLIKELKND